MLESITNYLYPPTTTEDARERDASAPAAPADVKARKAAAPASNSLPAVQVDENGRRLGLEDPNNPALVDDPNIFPTGAPVAAVAGPKPGEVITNYPAPTGDPSKTLVPSVGKPFIDPRVYGGRNLDQSAGLGEPLNVVISALSSPDVLTRKGLQSYFRSLDFDFECLGLNAGSPQQAWLDPRGWVDQNFLFREVYTPLDHLFGTCLESLVGGNHIRAWQQQGTGAWFLAVSKEKDATKHHMIIPDGYNIGRDEVVQQTQKKKDGRTSFFGKKYRTTVVYLTGLMDPGTQGVNHGIAVDGRTALLTVELLNPSKGDKKQVAIARNTAIVETPAASVDTSPKSLVPVGDATRIKPKGEKRSHQITTKIKKRFSKTINGGADGAAASTERQTPVPTTA